MLKEMLPLSRLNITDFLDVRVPDKQGLCIYNFLTPIQSFKNTFFTMVLGVYLDLNPWPLKTSAATYTTVSWRRP